MEQGFVEGYPFSMVNVVAFWIFLAAALFLFANTCSVRIGALLRAAPDARFDRPMARLRQLLTFAFAQKRMVRDLYAGIYHLLIFWGFVTLGLRSLSLVLQGLRPGFDPATFLGPYISGPYLLAKDAFEVLVIVGLLMAAYRRIFNRPERLHNSWDAWATLGMIGALMVTDLFQDGAYILLHSPEWVTWTPASHAVSLLLGGMGEAGLVTLFHAMWWIHLVTLFGFLNFLPYSKHFHVLTALFNVYFSDLDPVPKMKPMDLEAEHFGTNRIQDLTWKQMLDLYTCTECGRCKEVCPTTITEKPLKPKEFCNDLRDYLYETPLTDIDQAKGCPEDRPLVGGKISTDTIWACTTCGYCEWACPLFIKYVDKITDMRKYLTLEESDFPDEAQVTFRGMERQGNPWNIARADRANWAEGLDVPTISEKPDAEYLFWVGCAGAYEDRGKKVSQALVKLMKAAGVSFAILGEEETCTGDAARRLGNEYLFQMLAEANVEVLNGYKVKKIVTNCPHCLQTLANEYGDFGGHYEVVHGTQLVAKLIHEGRLKLTEEIPDSVTFHDPCYLARYNHETEAPRAVLEAIPGLSVKEMEKSGERGMCCGAGGGRMWLEETIGKRINHERLDHAVETGAKGVAVACPFCNVMLNNAAGETGREGFETFDIIELAAKAVK